MLNDPYHLFRRMWAAESWAEMGDGSPACWQRRRDEAWRGQSSDTYFRDVLSGAHCATNWYEGSPGSLGFRDRLPTFRQPAPALLGFDESIDDFCDNHGGDHAQSCVRSNLNILSLHGDRVPYNICRNLEWQVCAAKGLLPGQSSRVIKFAYQPSRLRPDGKEGKPFGQCQGWVPDRPPTGGVYGFATDDIFYLEVCLYSQLCENSDELFKLEVGDEFVCKFADSRFEELRALLMRGFSTSPTQRRCRGGSTGGRVREQVLEAFEEEEEYADEEEEEKGDTLAPEEQRGPEAQAPADGRPQAKAPAAAKPQVVAPAGPPCHAFCKYLHCFPNKRQAECSGCEFCKGPHPCDEFCHFQRDPCTGHPANCWGCSNCPGGSHRRRALRNGSATSDAT